MTRNTEDKGTAATEISAATCPEKHTHRLKLAQVCAACATLIPTLPAYTPDEYQRYFAPPVAESAPSPYAPDEENARLWREYEVANAAFEAAVFAVDDLRRGRSQIVGRHVGADGNVVEDHGVRVRAARSDQAIAEAVAVREKLRDAAQAVLFEIQKADARRGALARRAMYLESFPEPAPQPTLLERAASALKG